jgi:hypothetical protein
MVDTTDSLTFAWPRTKQMFRALFLLPLGLFLVVMCPVSVVDIALHQSILIAVLQGIFGLWPLMVAGIAMLYFAAFTDRKLTVSQHEIRVRHWIAGSRTADISSLVAIVEYGQPARLVFLPGGGPPLLTVDVDDFPDGMPAAIEEHLRVKIDRLGEVDKDELRAKYPRNAEESAQKYEFEDQWRGRKWQW